MTCRPFEGADTSHESKQALSFFHSFNQVVFRKSASCHRSSEAGVKDAEVMKLLALLVEAVLHFRYRILISYHDTARSAVAQGVD